MADTIIESFEMTRIVESTEEEGKLCTTFEFQIKGFEKSRMALQEINECVIRNPNQMYIKLMNIERDCTDALKRFKRKLALSRMGTTSFDNAVNALQECLQVIHRNITVDIEMNRVVIRAPYEFKLVAPAFDVFRLYQQESEEDKANNCYKITGEEPIYTFEYAEKRITVVPGTVYTLNISGTSDAKLIRNGALNGWKTFYTVFVNV